MVELFEQNIRTNERQSSKGNQLKWENDGTWYKADYTGYEGFAEYVISYLLKKSSLQDYEYVVYDTCKCQYKNVVFLSYKHVGKPTCLYDIFSYPQSYIASDPLVGTKVHLY